MHWKTREVLIILFGAVAILSLLATFLNTFLPLQFLCFGVAVLSFIIAMILKNMKVKVIKYKYKYKYKIEERRPTTRRRIRR